MPGTEPDRRAERRGRLVVTAVTLERHGEVVVGARVARRAAGRLAEGRHGLGVAVAASERQAESLVEVRGVGTQAHRLAVRCDRLDEAALPFEGKAPAETRLPVAGPLGEGLTERHGGLGVPSLFVERDGQLQPRRRVAPRGVAMERLGLRRAPLAAQHRPEVGAGRLIAGLQAERLAERRLGRGPGRLTRER